MRAFGEPHFANARPGAACGSTTSARRARLTAHTRQVRHDATSLAYNTSSATPRFEINELWFICNRNVVCW